MTVDKQDEVNKLLEWARHELDMGNASKVDKLLDVCRNMQDRKGIWIKELRDRIERLGRPWGQIVAFLARLVK